MSCHQLVVFSYSSSTQTCSHVSCWGSTRGQYIHLQLTYLSALLLQELVGEISTATVRAGLGILRPLVKTAFTEVSFTAVDQMRLTQDFHTNGTGWFYTERLKEIIIYSLQLQSGVAKPFSPPFPLILNSMSCCQ